MSSEQAWLDRSRLEAATIAAVRMVVEKYAEKHGVPFESAFSRLVESGFYDDLFDESLRYWAEGPEYLLNVWEQMERD